MSVYIFLFALFVLYLIWLSISGHLERKSKAHKENEIRRRNAEIVRMVHDKSANVYQPDDWDLRRKFVLQRDGNKCTECGETNGLEIHHIIERKHEFNHSVDNLVTLCIRCHHKVHGRNISQQKARETATLRANLNRKFGKHLKSTTARKDFTCNRCGKTISRGNKRHYLAGRYLMGNDYLCDECFQKVKG